MIPFFFGLAVCFGTFFRSRHNLGIEILALRQQLAVLKRKHPRPRLRIQDRMFWILVHPLWSGWRNALVIVKSETVIGWHRIGFRAFWRFRSRGKNAGRPIIDAEDRAAIQKMVEENPIGGAPRIHGEPISWPKHDLFWLRSMEDGQLMTESEDLDLERGTCS